MRLSVKALAATMAILAGSALLLIGLGNIGLHGYGAAALEVAASIYPGYHGPGGIGSVVVVTLYATLDGAVAGALIAWLYNAVSRERAEGAQRFSG
jgi:hypothetical protein